MRLWSIHPKYLDSKGLVAVWREGLLAQKCLSGHTKGYNHHPQLKRFKESSNSLIAMGSYLRGILSEAEKRHYNFDSSKILSIERILKMKVTKNQLEYEWQHFLKKIETRDPSRYEQLRALKTPDTHPLFDVVLGGIEEWEVIG